MISSTDKGDNTFDNVCYELDQLTLEYLSKINQYILDRAATSSELQKGFLDLAHAKYTMGAKTISRFSYDERMKALVQLNVDDSNTMPYTMTRLTPDKMERKSKTTEQTKLRQRKEDKDTDKVTDKGDEDKDKADKADKKAAKLNGNPLHWFGFLVSPSLRTSQSHFEAATTHYIDLANLIHDLGTLEQRYEALKKKKQDLMREQLHKDTETMTTTLSSVAI